MKIDKIILVIIMSFMQGANDFTLIPFFYYYKDNLWISPTDISLISSFVMIPWVMKPFLGYLSDLYPIFGYKRKSYLIFSCLVEILCYLILSLNIKFSFIVINLNFIIIFSLVVRCVIGEAIIVEITQNKIEKEKDMPVKKQKVFSQKMVSIWFGSKTLGSLIFLIISGYAKEKYEFSKIILFTSIFPFTVLLYLIFMYEEKDNQINNRSYSEVKSNLISIFKTIKQPDVWIYLKIALLLILNPSYAQIFNYYFTKILNFSSVVLGKINFVSNLFFLIGILLFNSILKNLEFLKFYSFSLIFSFFLSIMTLLLILRINLLIGISDIYFSLIGTAIYGLISDFNSMPILSLCARKCPKHLEGTSYSIYTAITNMSFGFSVLLGSLLGKILGVTQYNFDNLWILMVIQMVYLLCLQIYIKTIKFPEETLEIKNENKYLNDNEENWKKENLGF